MSVISVTYLKVCWLIVWDFLVKIKKQKQKYINLFYLNIGKKNC